MAIIPPPLAPLDCEADALRVGDAYNALDRERRHRAAVAVESDDRDARIMRARELPATRSKFGTVAQQVMTQIRDGVRAHFYNPPPGAVL